MTRANKALKWDRAGRADLVSISKYNFSGFDLNCVWKMPGPLAPRSV